MSKTFTPDEIERMVRLGQLGMITGDRNLSGVGELEFKRGQRIGEFQDELAEKQAQRQLLDRYYGAQEARWAREPGEKARDRQLRLELGRLGLMGDLALAGVEGEKLTPTQTQQANDYAVALDEIRDMKARAASLPGISDKGKALGVEAAKAAVPDRFEPLAGQWATEKLYSPEESRLLRDLNSQLATRVKLLSGAASSDKERAFIESFMPRAGMRPEDLMSSLDTLEQYVSERAERSRHPIRSLREDAAKTPAKTRPRVRRKVGNKSYVEVGPGRWQEEETAEEE
jgi:hypothetical protein